MVIKKKSGQIVLEKSGSQIAVFPVKNFKPDEKVTAIISRESSVGSPFWITGAGEWEFSEIFIYGYKGDQETFYYLAIADNANALFLENFMDLDTANKAITYDIDMFVIPFKEELMDSDRLKKDIGAIETGNIVFYWESGENPSESMSAKLKDYLGVSEIRKENKFRLEGGIRDNKYFYVFE